MKLIWTKSNLPLSLFIRAVTGEPCSHFAFVFESGIHGLMFESNLIGTHPVFFKGALQGFGAMTVVHEKAIPVSVKTEDLIWDKLVEKYDDKPYDYGGALFTGVAVLANRTIGANIPDRNKWSKNGTYDCVELYDLLTEFIPSLPKLDVVGSCITPERLWEKVKDANIQ